MAKPEWLPVFLLYCFCSGFLRWWCGTNRCSIILLTTITEPWTRYRMSCSHVIDRKWRNCGFFIPNVLVKSFCNLRRTSWYKRASQFKWAKTWVASQHSFLMANLFELTRIYMKNEQKLGLGWKDGVVVTNFLNIKFENCFCDLEFQWILWEIRLFISQTSPECWHKLGLNIQYHMSQMTKDKTDWI